MPDIEALHALWTPLRAFFGTRLTSLTVNISGASGTPVRLLLGLDRPDLPRYADALPQPLAPLALHAGHIPPLAWNQALGIAAGSPPSTQQGEVVLYNSGRFREQGIEINIWQDASACSRRERARPEAPRGSREDGPGLSGSSIGGWGAKSGTLCLPVQVNQQWTHVLSCAHVLVPDPLPAHGGPYRTLMPGPAEWPLDAPGPEAYTIGEVDRYLYGSARNAEWLPDIAVARLLRPLPGPGSVPGAGPLRRTEAPVRTTPVTMLGRTSGMSHGEITEELCIVAVGTCSARHFARASYGSQRGDSGGLVHRTVDGAVIGIGMHVGRELDFAYFLPLEHGLRQLECLGIDVSQRPTSTSNATPTYSVT